MSSRNFCVGSPANGRGRVGSNGLPRKGEEPQLPRKVQRVSVDPAPVLPNRLLSTSSAMECHWSNDDDQPTIDDDSLEKILALEACGGPNGTPRYTRTNGPVYQYLSKPRTNGAGYQCDHTFESFLAVEVLKRLKISDYRIETLFFINSTAVGVLKFRALTHEAHELKLLDV